MKIAGDSSFKAEIGETCAGDAKKTRDELDASDKVFWVVQGSQFCQGPNDATQPQTGRPGCYSPNGIAYEGTGGSPYLRVPPDLAAWLGAGKITGGVALINDQQLGGFPPSLYKGRGEVAWHEMTHLLGVARTGRLYVHLPGSCPSAFRGVPGPCR